MKYLFALIIIFPALGISAQNFSKHVYKMGSEYSLPECRVTATQDICSSDIVFLSPKKFIMILRCQDGESYQRGKYVVKNKKIRLEFCPNVVVTELDEKTNKIKLSKQNLVIIPVEYDITTCENGEYVIQFPGHKTMSYGSRYPEPSETEALNALKNSEAYKLLND